MEQQQVRVVAMLEIWLHLVNVVNVRKQLVVVEGLVSVRQLRRTPNVSKVLVAQARYVVHPENVQIIKQVAHDF